jgi:hypothetical protein
MESERDLNWEAGEKVKADADEARATAEHNHGSLEH